MARRRASGMGGERQLLAVDDDPAFLDLVKGYFSERDFSVTTALNPQRAVDAMKRYPYRAVILDYEMPKTKGDDLITLLQGMNPAARFIVVTGHQDCEVEHKFKGLGYFAYFEKASLDWKDLEGRVKEALS